MVSVWVERAIAKGARPARGLMNASAIGVLHVGYCLWSSAAVHRGNHVSPNPGLAAIRCYLVEQSGFPISQRVNSKREDAMGTRNQPLEDTDR